jgi:hypothetical protein
MKTAAIVVQIYKPQFSADEKISLTQLMHMLSRYPIVLIAPENMDTAPYKDLLKQQLVNVVTFPERFFRDLKGYNRLLLSQEYYRPFLNYDYILIHHTDAFVFKDEMSLWMSKDYDNIGAPIYHYDGTRDPAHYICTGNGGFCLRKVKTFYSLAGNRRIIYRFSDVKENFLKYNWRGRLYRMPYYALMLCTFGARLNSSFNKVRVNEDVIWGHYVAKYFDDFKNAPFADGLRFGMEFNCGPLLEANSGELPFGCHGWQKPMFRDFWRPHIESFGYTID